MLAIFFISEAGFEPVFKTAVEAGEGFKRTVNGIVTSNGGAI